MDTLPPRPSSSAPYTDKRKDQSRRDRRAEKYAEVEAGPSRPRPREFERDDEGDGSSRRKKRSKGKAKEKPVLNGILNGLNGTDASKRQAANQTFEMGEDFVPFVASSEDEEQAPVREWDKGKGKARATKQDFENDREDGGKKRKYDLVFDDDDLIQQKREKSFRKAPWVTAVDWESCKNVAEMLHREVEAFVNYISPTPVEDEVRSLVVDLVSRAVTQAFPDAEVKPFGSFGTKLYLPLGDIDLVVSSESMAYSDKISVLHALANTLKRAKITSKVTIIAKAKVPIVKFITSHGRLNVDISVNQGNGVLAGQIVNGFLKDMHGGGMALRSLVMIIKAFLNQRGMNEVYTGGLGSYSIVCLAVSFLQMHPKIRRGEIDAERNLGVLVMEFFELYGCYFNYEQVGISLRGGGTYFSKRSRGWQNDYKKSLLSIEDPTDSSNDISKGSFGIQKVRTTFAGAHGILTAAAYLRAGMMRSRDNGRSFSLKGHDSEDASILSNILGVTQETINHRRLIQEVYEDRTLHRMLGVEPRKIAVPPHITDSRRTISFQPESSRNDHTKSKVSAQVVEEIFEEVDMEIGSDIEELEKPKKRDHVAEEEGRYSISVRREPPSKRRRMGTAQDTHTVFTTDDEEEEEGLIIQSTITDEGESLDEYETSGLEDAQDSKAAQQDRRSYWLSKGIGTGRIDDDSN